MSRTPFRTLCKQTGGNATGINDTLWESVFMKALRGEKTPYPPVWLMRQAGRYMAEYRAVREGKTFLDMCHNADIATEVTVYARNRIGADAAIIFADILLILDHLGMDLTFGAGHGPKLNPPIRCAADLDRLGDPIQAAADCSYVCDAVRMTREQLPEDIPLIGFSGAPFTLAAYACEGGGSRQFPHTHSLMYNDPASWHKLQEKLVPGLTAYLNSQIKAGAQAIQIFDSWVGILSSADYREFVLPHMKTLIDGIVDGIPVIYFGTNTGHLLSDMQESGCDCLGVDNNTDLVSAWENLGGSDTLSIQGNLDPALLLAPKERLLAATDKLLASVGDRPGWIFNLGHGVFKETNVNNVIDLIKHIQKRD